MCLSAGGRSRLPKRTSVHLSVPIEGSGVLSAAWKQPGRGAACWGGGDLEQTLDPKWTGLEATAGGCCREGSGSAERPWARVSLRWCWKAQPRGLCDCTCLEAVSNLLRIRLQHIPRQRLETPPGVLEATFTGSKM